MAKPWRAHVDFSCPECGRLLVDCTDHFQSDQQCLSCGAPAKLIGIGSSKVGNAQWYRSPSCGQLHMLRRGEFVTTGERSGTVEFGSSP